MTTIREMLIPALEAAFPERGLRLGGERGAIATFPAQHPSVGNITIWDDGDEATVEIGRITHGQFNPYAPELSDQAVAAAVTEMVIAFLENVFCDRVLFDVDKSRRSGGWQVFDHPVGSVPNDDTKDFFVWSRPLEP